MITDEQIWSYLDGTLDEANRTEVAQAIASNKEVAALFKELSALHTSLQTDTLLSPSALFTDRVMLAVAPAPVKASIQPVLIFIVPVIIALLACVGYLVYNNVTLDYTLPSFSLPQPAHYTLYFILTDVVILAFFAEALSDYRFNHKAYHS